MSSHLTRQQMLLHLDGEISRWEARRLERHLRSCWTCRSEVEKLKTSIGIVHDAYREQFVPLLQEPQRPWAPFETLLANSSPCAPQGLWNRLAEKARLVWPSVIAAAALTIVCAILLFTDASFRAKSVSAKEILYRVQAANERRSTINRDQVIRQRVRIRKRSHSHGRTEESSLDTWKSREAVYWDAPSNSPIVKKLTAEYQSHKIPLDLPISTSAINAWGQAAGGNPVVVENSEKVELRFLPATDTTNDPVKLSLEVHTGSWQIERLVLQFGDDADFDISEDKYSIMPMNAVPKDVLAHLMPLEKPASATTMIAERSLPVAAEINLNKTALDVMSALHDLRADLGEPINVSRTSRSIAVELWQLAPDRRAEIERALTGKPNVEIVLSPRNNPETTQTESGHASLNPTVELTQPSQEEKINDRRFLEYFGSLERERDFANESLTTASTILSHLYALRTLQQQFPKTQEPVLSPEEKQRLHQLVHDHVTSSIENMGALERQLAPLATHFVVTVPPTAVTYAAGDWRTDSLEALRFGREADTRLRQLMTSTASPISPEDALPQILASLAQLRTQLTYVDAETH